MSNESKVKNENSFIINGWMLNELKLSGNALMVYAIIFGFSQDGESYFTGSRKYLCDFIGATKPTIDKAINELVEKGYILKYSEKRNDIIYNKYQVNLNVLNFTSGKDSLPPHKETLPNNKVDNKEYNINNNNTDNKKEIEKEKAVLTINNNDVEIVYNYYEAKAKLLGYYKNKLQVKDSTLNNIKNYLKEYSVEYLKESIDRYFQVISDKDYYFDTYWKPEDFFKQKNSLPDFFEEGSKWVNYKNFKERQKSKNPYKPNEEISRETAYPELNDYNVL